jgi:hypothetical protein
MYSFCGAQPNKNQPRLDPQKTNKSQRHHNAAKVFYVNNIDLEECRKLMTISDVLRTKKYDFSVCALAGLPLSHDTVMRKRQIILLRSEHIGDSHQLAALFEIKVVDVEHLCGIVMSL